MFKNFHLVKFLDVDIEVNTSLLILLGIVGVVGGAWALLLWTLLFLCIVLHEYGHILTGRAYGISFYKIVMTPLGGMALTDMVENVNTYNAKQQFWIALAGPLVSAALAVILLPLGFLTGSTLITQVGFINIVLVIFNLIPAYPMDGGRIFKSLMLLFCTKNYRKASRITGITGMACSAAMTLFFLANGVFISALIGIFIGYQAWLEWQSNRKVRT
jgi:Zn-dependent protease